MPATRERRGWLPAGKLNIQKTKIMASGPITSWEIDGETVVTVSDFILAVPSFHGKYMVDGEKVETVTDFLFLASNSL